MRKSWTRSPVTTALDRGPARYFHGRKQILRDFSEIATDAIQRKSGTTFLIQGAPGAGKTALLTECESLAQKSGWETTEISSAALWDPNELQQSLKLRRTWKVGGGSARVGISGIGEAEINAERSPETVKNLLRGSKNPLLLTLDEAQILGKENEFPSDRIRTVRHVLNAIHNGRLDRPVIFIAAGLGTTEGAFRSLGVSRFATRCLVRLGALDKEAERAVLRDWLSKDGQAKGDPTAWIDAITQETYGWPQHILSYVDPALKQLNVHKRVMTTEGLNAVLEAGRGFRSEYYDGRLHEFEEEHRRSFAKLLVDVPLGGSIAGSVIRSSLAQEYGHEEASKLFRSALDCGILHKRAGRYAVPIPSMQDWLVSNYAHVQEKGGSSRALPQSPARRSTAIVTQDRLNQEITAQSPGQSRDEENRNPEMDFGR